MNHINIEKLLINQTKTASFIGISYCFFTPLHNAGSTMIKPLLFEKEKWLILASSPIESTGTLTLNTESSSYTYKVTAEEIFFDEDKTGFYYHIFFNEDIEYQLQQKIQEYNNLAQYIEKRKEQRFEVGIAKTALFSLEKERQLLYTDTNEKLRCIINNVSMGGALLTADKANLIAGKNIVMLQVRFVHPMQTISLKASIVYVGKLNDTFYRYSLQFIQPVSLEWQQRVSDYSTKE